MMEHGEVRNLLALAASGALSPEDQRRVEAHCLACEACGREVEAWQALAGALSRLPSPQPPPALAAQCAARVAASLSRAADRQWDEAMVAVLALFAWTLTLAGWSVIRMLTGGALVLFDTTFVETVTWLTATTVLAWITAGLAAILIARRRQLARRTV